MSDTKKQNAFWPNVSTLEGAKAAATHGMTAALIVAALTTVMATWALMSSSTVLGFVDAAAYVDAALFLAIAFGIRKESRFAAIAGLALFLVEKAFQIQSTGKFDGAILALFLALLFISGIRGTFALRRLRAAHGSTGESLQKPSAE